MKTLYIHRHAKAVKEGYDSDFNRALKPSGVEDARRIGRFLKDRAVEAQLILCSPAQRAMQTAGLISSYTKEPIVADERIYAMGWEALMTAVHQQRQSWDALRIVGHNPDLEAYCSMLCGIAPGGIHLATGGIVCIQMPIGAWNEALPGSGHLRWMVVPALL